MAHNFSLCITSFNRKDELSKTLSEMASNGILSEQDVLICDDGSKDGTFEFVQSNYPDIILFRHNSSKGLIYSRNELMDKVRTPFAFFLDDDASFLSKLNLKSVKSYFENNPNCAVLALRIFWGINKPDNNLSHEEPHRVKSFVGCGHIWRTSAWHQIPDYPEWFKFYGEEDFAAFHLFKRGLEVHYYPDILIHHRVDIKSRKKNKDYIQRTRRAIRSGWYLYLMFYPKRLIVGRMTYSIWIQLKTKVFKGDLKALIAINLAILDLLLNILRIFRYSNRFSKEELLNYNLLSPAIIFS
jgi:GT2 family glycosyltransferase